MMVVVSDWYSRHESQAPFLVYLRPAASVNVVLLFCISSAMPTDA